MDRSSMDDVAMADVISVEDDAEPNGRSKSPHQPISPAQGSKRQDSLTAPGLARLPMFKALPYATLPTGLVYDVRMRFHVEAIPVENDIHPEDPRRIHVIYEAFVHAGLVWRPGCEGPTDFYMARIDARMVTREEVCLVHTENHYDWIQSLKLKSADQLVDELQHPGEYKQMDSVYLCPSTPYCAALSAGGAIEACRAILLGQVKNVFAVIRPPGHHAEREDVKGFCFYDNVSIATKACQREFGQRCRKVFVLDWDVHHGNGIQQANYADPNVLYISLHVHKNGNFYPEGSYRDHRESYGDHLHCGEGAGLGKNVNIPWRNHGMGDADYLYAFQQVIMPIATEFDPDLVIIAAGFDAADGDMLGGCHVSPAGYAHMTHMLMSLAGGKVAVCLEGGYNLDSIARSAAAVGRTLMGEPPDRLENLAPTKTGVDDVKLVLRQQSKFWSSLYPKDSFLQRDPQRGESMDIVVRKWQASLYWDDFEMSPLFIHREHLSKSFENQVLATTTYTEARPLLVILHDPPDMLPSPDPRTGKTELHNSWLADSVKSYVDWAVGQEFAVIDVNLNKHVVADDVRSTRQHEDVDSVESRTREATTLLTYLWENYIDVGDATHVFLLGTNTGHGAIVNFIKAHEDRTLARVTKFVSFVDDVPLQSIKSATNDGVPQWYYDNSLVFISETHNFWQSEFARKIKRRFGRVFRSPCTSASEMLRTHQDEVQTLLSDATETWRALAASRLDNRLDDGADLLRNMPPLKNFAPPHNNSRPSSLLPGAPSTRGGKSPL